MMLSGHVGGILQIALNEDELQKYADIEQTAQGSLKKTLSVGISLFPRDGQGFWECVKFSDISLYYAKEHGRDQCVMFTEAMRVDKEQY